MNAKDKNNATIAEFMGHSAEEISVDIKKFKYDSDWNSLNQVADKIISLGFWISDIKSIGKMTQIGKLNESNSFIHVLDSSLMKSNYKAYLKFIKWYKEEKK